MGRKNQLSILLHCVEINQKEGKSKEDICGILHIACSAGSGLFEDSVLSFLDEINLDLENGRGQSYDNGANMRGQYKDVQNFVKERNSREFYVPYANRAFNLMVCDAEKSATYEINYFGTVQRF
jgi:hypothetical protein